MSERDDRAGAEKRTVLVDASVFITLAEIGNVGLPLDVRGDLVVPRAVHGEITDEPAASELDDARKSASIRVVAAESDDRLTAARSHLGVDPQQEPRSGDVALLALALDRERVVVVSDDRPLRRTCKALSIPVTGSIGVVIRAVERGDVEPDDAKSALYAMDEVGARLSASLVRRAERLIDQAADE